MNVFQKVCASLQTKLRFRRMKGLLMAFADGLERARTRRLLGQMNEHQLSDMGISLADRLNELDKSFWR
jgi:uncharacterized protein YjiS (DUF1127 family)